MFSFNAPSLKLYVDLCAWSQFLSEILVNNPGMIDELLDSLVLDQPRGHDELRAELAELCKGATDLDPILHSFQDKELLRIGVRDILHKSSIRETTRGLSDLAETILAQVGAAHLDAVTRKYGNPTLEDGNECRFAVLALGKLGAGEMNYHSDLDLMIVYEGDGRTMTPPRTRADRHEPTDMTHFYTDFAQRLIRALSHHGPMGQLYQVDMRLRPTGKSGNLVLPLAEFRRYFMASEGATHAEGGAQLWERQALTRARVVLGQPAFAAQVREAVTEATFHRPWLPHHAEEIASMRDRLEASRHVRDLKRGPGGLADIEFLLQRFLLAHGGTSPTLRTTNTRIALAAIRDAGLITGGQHDELIAGYDFLLRVQNRLRIVHNRTIDVVPENADEVEKLARRLGFDSGAKFLTELEEHRRRIRGLYGELMRRG